jgi:hypothetical protein
MKIVVTLLWILAVLGGLWFEVKHANMSLMNAVWVVPKIALYTFVLNVLYRQSYNFLFFLARRPLGSLS